MAKITVVSRQGVEKEIEAHKGQTLMEAIRDSGFGDVQALCGGCCSCATCHVYVAAAFTERLMPGLSEAENDLLDGTLHRKSNSRLSCQIKIEDDLSGLKVTVAPDE